VKALRFAAAVLALGGSASCYDFTLADRLCEDGGRCASPPTDGGDAGAPDAGTTDAGRDGGSGDAGGDAGADAGNPDCCLNNGACANAATKLASTPTTQPQGIAVDPTWLYWINDDGSFVRAQHDGGNAQTLGSIPIAGRSLVVDPNYLSMIGYDMSGNDGGLFTCLHDGGQLTPVMQTRFMFGPTELNGVLYWMGNNRLWSGLPDGGSLFQYPIGSGLNGVQAMASSPERVFLGQNAPLSQVTSVQADSGTATVLASNQAVADVAFDGSAVYWVTAVDGGSWGLYRILPDGGAFTPLAAGAGPASPQALAIDSSGVYWTFAKSGNAFGKLMTLPFDGGPATCLQSGLFAAYRLALDANTVYWTDRSAAGVYSVPKP